MHLSFQNMVLEKVSIHTPKKQNFESYFTPEYKK